jgi:hypothetical protein
MLAKADTLNTAGRYKFDYHKYYNNKHLIPAKNGQFTPPKRWQSHWLLQIATVWEMKELYRSIQII